MDNFGNVTVFDASNGRMIWQKNAGTGQLNTADFSGTGNEIVTSGDDGTTRIWDANTGANLGVLGPTPVGLPGSVRAAVFSPTEPEILTVSTDGALRVWSTEVAKPLTEIDKLAAQRLAS